MKQAEYFSLENGDLSMTLSGILPPLFPSCSSPRRKACLFGDRLHLGIKTLFVFR